MAERTCDQCGETYARAPALIGRFCSQSCAQQAGAYGPRRKDINDLRSRYRMVNRRGHPLAPPSGIFPEHRLVLWEKIGPGHHQCHWCGTTVEWRVGQGPRQGALVVDHVDNNSLNNSPDNLVAACQACNGVRSRAVQDDEEYKVRRNGTRLRIMERFCLVCGTKFKTYSYRKVTCDSPCASVWRER